MRRSHFTDAEIIRLLREAETGMSIAEICLTSGVSQRTFYRWRERFAGLATPDVSKMRELQMENRRLRSVLEDLVQTPAVRGTRSASGPPPRPSSSAPTPRGGMVCYPFLRVRP